MEPTDFFCFGLYRNNLVLIHSHTKLLSVVTIFFVYFATTCLSFTQSLSVVTDFFCFGIFRNNLVLLHSITQGCSRFFYAQNVVQYKLYYFSHLLLPTSRISRCTGKAEGRLVRWLWDRFRYNRAPNFNFYIIRASVVYTIHITHGT